MVNETPSTKTIRQRYTQHVYGYGADFDAWLSGIEDAAYQEGYEDGLANANTTKSVRQVIEENGGTSPTVQGWA